MTHFLRAEFTVFLLCAASIVQRATAFGVMCELPSNIRLGSGFGWKYSRPNIKKLHFKLCKMRTGERRGESTASMSFRSQWLVNIARDKMGLAFTVFMLYQNIYFCMRVMHKRYFDSASVISDKRLPLANKIRAKFAVAFYQRPAIAEILLRKNLHC